MIGDLMNEVKIEPWKEISREQIFKKYSRRIDKVIYELPSGEQTDFYIKEEGECCVVFALTSENQVILARQFRQGPNKILNEIPGGGIEKDENPEDAAARELLEETGYKGDIKFITRVYDCAYSTMHRYCFIATNCQKVQEPKDDPNEPCQTVLMPLEKFRSLLRSGEMTDVEVGYLALDYLNLL